MRQYSLAIFVFALIAITPKVPAQGLLKIDYPMRVITYNIRFDNPADGDNAWNNRKERVADLLQFHQADIFCLQEALLKQIEYLETAFPDFDYYGLGRDDGKQGGEFCPIFYKKSRFKVLDSGSFWLSETPEVAGSTGWFATLPRITGWVKLRDLSSAKDFYVFNTHLDHASQDARDNGSRLIMERINRQCENLPVILTGDFNDRPGSKPYKNVIYNNGSIEMFDANARAKHSHYGPSFTWVGWDFIGIPGNIIDYIFVNKKVRVSFHAALGDNWDGIYPSDHIPLLIQATLQ